MRQEDFRERGKFFDDPDVAESYAHRPAYPPELFDALLARVPGRAKLLDLGTGNGKIAGTLAAHFAHVIAIDPSPAMLDVARRTWPEATNISWVCETAESAPFEGPFDLVTAGASIHWMDPAALFAKLSERMTSEGMLAVILGDWPQHPPWQVEWDRFVERWAVHLNDTFKPEIWRPEYSVYQSWTVPVFGATFNHQVTQSVDDYIECQHARAPWTRRRLGAALSEEFDDEIRSLLAPYAKDGQLTFQIESSLNLGRVLGAPRES